MDDRMSMERSLILLMRLSIGWVFLYAGITQALLTSNWSAAGFLQHTKTFHALYAPIATSSLLPLIDFCVKWGHLLIGLSLIFGLLVRVSGIFGVLLMLVYWSAHLDFPYVDTPLNFILDEHIVYAIVIAYLMAVRAGHVFGLDGWIGRQPPLSANPPLRPLAGRE
jgi:thiosulfate dehydrogenase [quinone] large subunit